MQQAKRVLRFHQANAPPDEIPTLTPANERLPLRRGVGSGIPTLYCTGVRVEKEVFAIGCGLSQFPRDFGSGIASNGPPAWPPVSSYLPVCCDAPAARLPVNGVRIPATQNEKAPPTGRFVDREGSAWPRVVRFGGSFPRTALTILHPHILRHYRFSFAPPAGAFRVPWSVCATYCYSLRCSRRGLSPTSRHILDTRMCRRRISTSLTRRFPSPHTISCSRTGKHARCRIVTT